MNEVCSEQNILDKKVDNNQKTLTITFCGAPNVGKSTLLNQLLQCKLAICSPKPQTTRDNIRGIITRNNTQLVLVDTPGIFRPKLSQLEKQIVKEAWGGMCGTDLICVIIDAQKGIDGSAKTIIEKTKHNAKNTPLIAIINKSDLINFDKKILLAEQLKDTGRFQDIFSLSAKNGNGCNELLEYFFSLAKNGPWQFAEDDLTDKDNNFIASEFVREQLFLILSKELPYMLSCETELFDNDGQRVLISVLVKIGKENHKKMILGEGGKNLKRIIRNASRNLESLLGLPVKLNIYIKLEHKK